MFELILPNSTCYIQKGVKWKVLVMGKTMTSFTKGHTSHNHKEEVGNKYGDLVVIKRTANDLNNNSMWLCKCVCGTEKIVRASMLRNGKVKSCGCLVSRIGIHKRSGLSPLKRLYRSTKIGALYRGIRFDISFGEYRSIVKQKCFYCGEEPHDKHYAYSTNKLGDEYDVFNGIDRVDNLGDYNTHNCVSCCFACNRMKSDIELDVFLGKVL